MGNLYGKINERWLRYKNWSTQSLAGDFTMGIVKILFAALVLFLILWALGSMGVLDEEDTSSDLPIGDASGTNEEDCSVKGIALRGTLITYIPNHSENDTAFDYDVVASENITWLIDNANDSPQIKVILIEIDSGGGSSVAGEEISSVIKNSEKPVIATIRQMGASASYWAISGADKIFASASSSIGSIGVTNSYLSNTEKNRKDGYTYEQIIIGKYKDSGSPDKPLTSEERQLFLRDMEIIYNNFMKEISDNRKLSIEEVKSFADGSTVLGEKAKSLGLIDEIGGKYETEKYIEELIGEQPTICW